MDIIYVVHGSNAHSWWRRLANGGYPWWRRWSLFCCAVREAFGKECEIREFRWSGHNTHQARLDAGADLARAVEAESGGRRVHLIGHSHGGNVALHAVNCLPDHKVESVVVLANPQMALIDSRGTAPEWLYWGKAAQRVSRIWNLYSPEDVVQSKLAAWFHGIPKDRRRHLHVRQRYAGMDHNSVQNAEIHWKRRLAAHISMHSESVGSCVGTLLRGGTIAEAMRSAGLSVTEANDVSDRGGWPGIHRTFEMIRKRADPAAFDLGNPSARIGVLFVHGFTASASEMRPMAQAVSKLTDWRCRGLLLPGHGTRIEDMQQTSSKDWTAAVERELEALAGDCDHVFLVGLSLGAVICCDVVQRNRGSAKLRGMILLAPAFGVTRPRSAGIRLLRLVRYVGTKRRRAADYFLDNRLYTYLHLPMSLAAEVMELGGNAAQNMGKLREFPVMIFAGDRESTVSLGKIRAVARDNPWIRFVRLPRSRHILTVEPDREVLFEASVRFMEECLRGVSRGV